MAYHDNCTILSIVSARKFYSGAKVAAEDFP